MGIVNKSDLTFGLLKQPNNKGQILQSVLDKQLYIIDLAFYKFNSGLPPNNKPVKTTMNTGLANTWTLIKARPHPHCCCPE